MRKIALAGVLTLGLIDVASAQTATNSATVTPPGTVTNPGTSCVAPNNFNSATGACTATDTDTIVVPVTVTKTLTGAPAGGVDGTYAFTLTCGTNTYNGSVVLGGGALTGQATVNVPVGSTGCTVAETSTPPAPTNYTWGTATYVQPTSPIAAGATATITNPLSANPGTLTITKTITGGTSATALSFPYTVTCATPSNTYTGNVTVAAGASNGTATVNNIPAGSTCTVAEGTLPPPPSNYSWGTPTYTQPSGAMAPGGTQTATIANSLARNQVTLTVTKDVTGAPATGAPGSYDFSVSCANPTASYTGSVVLTGTTTSGTGTVTIPEGSTGCTVTETSTPTAPTNYTWGTATYVQPTSPIAAGATATITNPLSANPGTLTITKTITGGTSATALSFPYTVTCATPSNTYTGNVTVAAGASNGTATVNNIPAGSTCTVAEGTLPPPPSNYSWGTPTYTQPSGAMAPGGTQTATIANSLARNQVTLTVTKDVTGAPATGAPGSYDFSVSCANPTASYTGSVVLTGTTTSGTGTVTIPEGSTGCTVTETSTPTAPTNYTWGTATYVQPTSPIAAGATATITNPLIDMRADVSVVKTLTTAGPYLVGQQVSYTITVANAGPSTATNVAVSDTPTNLSGLVFTGACTAMPCTIASIAPNASATITVTGTITADGAFSNSATATPTEADPDPNNNTGSDGDSTTPTADVSLTKVLDTAGPYLVGQQVSYTITVANAGPSTATNVAVSDTPTNLSGLVFTGACTAMPCTIASIAPNASATITVTGTITADGAFSNSATATPTEADPDPNNNTGSDGDSTTPTADVSLTKVLDTAGPYLVGQQVSYTITVANAGPSTATNVAVSDTPTNLSGLVFTGACTAMPCTIASIAPNASATITVTGTITADGAFSNSATATPTEADPDPNNNTGSDGDSTTPTADVSLTKVLDTAGPYLVGQQVSYTITVANAGPSTATNVAVSDTPTNLSGLVFTGACTAMPCTIASIAPNASATITVTGTITADGAFSNSATATPTEADPDPNNNTGSDGDSTTPTADVSLTKVLDTAGPYLVGQQVSYTITVANAGPSTATNVAVSDTPTNLSGLVFTGACTAMPCTIASIAPNASATITVTGTITADGAFSNSATATPTEADPDPNNNTGSDGDSTTPTADVSLTKVLDTAGPYLVGQQVSYTITVANAGPSTATNVAVSDTPTNLSGLVFTGACTAMPCTIASIAPNASATITVTGTITADGAFSNSATATPTEADPDPNNNTGSDGDSTTPTADVSLTKVLDTAGPYLVGQQVSYTITVANAGPSTATNVAVSDTPTNLSGLVFTGACTAMPCTIASIAPNASATITVTGTITADGAFSNSATATPTEADPDPNNNTGSDGDSTTPTADVSLTKVLDTAGPYLVGQQVSYTITVANAGPSTATNVAVSDTPTNLSGLVFTGACTAMPCTIASIAPNASATITVTGTITADGAFSNSATATPTEADPDPNNNTGSDGDSTTPTADVSLTKVLDTAGPYLVGQQVSYTITVANAGPSTATNVAVSDTPTNLSGLVFTGACTAMPCTIASIAPNASATITVTGTITADGAFSNSATATPTEADPDPNNNTGSDGDSTTPTADVSLTKVLDTAGPYLVGQQVSYTITVANAGPSTATNVAVSDTPTNLSGLVFTGACTAMPCTIASIAPNASATITVTGTITADGAFSNSATATPTEADPDPNNNTGSDGDSTTPTADVSLTKVLDTAGPYLVGQQVSYTITVANAGPSTATNVAVSDTPTNLSGLVFTGACTAMPCTIASIAPNASATITVTGTITADGAFSNSATATPTEADPDPNNNTGSDGDSTTPTADVSLTKVLDTAGPYLVGQQVSYTITVANAGPSTATNVAVSDTPTNLSGLVFTGACTAMPCTIASIAPNASATITVTGTITADGAFSNSATATPTEADPDPNNNTGSDGDSTTPTADVSLTKVLDTAGPYLVGQQVSYTITVANAGPSTATNVAVSDTPTNLSGLVFTGACTAMPCTIASIAPNASATITVTGTITADGAFSNSATATPTEADPDPNNNTGSDGDSTTPTADVSLTKVLDTAGPYLVGQQVSYTITVANAGPSTATNVAVSDTPTNLSGLVFTGACTAMPCTIASIAPNASATITVTGTITADGAFSNSATATPTEADPDPNNNTGSDGDSTTPTADVSLTKVLDTAGPYLVGQQVSYTITVANAGPSTATNVAVSDTPTNLSGLVFTGACTAMPCTIASIAPNASATITVTGTITADGAFSNSATATPTEADPDPNNNTGSDGDSTTPTADVSLTKVLDTAGPYLVGQQVSYTITVANAGPSTATNVAVSDTPTNLSGLVFTGACTAMPCTIASIAPNASATITVTGTITADGAFSNSATATPTEADPDPNNNTGSDGDSTTPTADVSLTKVLDTAGPYLVGQQVSYTITVANAGPSTATNVAVSDTPTNLSGLVFTGACTAMPCTIASIAPNASATITVTGTITADGAFSNSATATPTEADPDPNNNTGSDGDSTTPTADVSLTKVLDTAGPYLVGQQVSYTITVANAGPSTATNVAVSDTPTNLSGLVFTGACTAMPCTIASIAPNASATITVTGTITADGAFSNSATATPTEADPDPNNNTGSDGDSTTPTADVSLTKVLDTAGPYLVGQQVSYTITVANAGPSTATNVAVSDTPTNLSGLVFTGACTAMPCTIASIAPNASATITVTGTITADGAFSNSATATPTEADPDPNNNTGSDGDSTTPTADVSLTKVLDTAGPYLVGQQVSYTITVANAGPSTATNVAVSDTPTNLSGLVFTGACTAMPCTIASIAPNASATITVTGTITADGAFSNSATATPTEADPDPNNNTGSDGDISTNVIDAVDDTMAPVNGGTGGTTPTVLANDTLNGAPVNPADVALTPGTSPNPGLVMNADGTITIAPNTPAGTYVYPYTICEVVNPTNCDTATATVVVTAPAIDAVDDTMAPVNGGTGGTTPTVLANDTLNGAPVNPADVALTPGTSPNPGLVMNADGTITIAPNTPAGTYVYPYTICEVVNPTNCDTATATVVVTAPAIDAVDDTMAPVNGGTGGTTPTVLANDTLNGAPVNPADVALTPGTSPNPGLVMNADGTITIAPNTPAGTYVYPYTICEVVNPTNCDTATVTVTVSPSVLVANPDAGTVGSEDGGPVVPNVLDNDTINGQPMTIDQVNLTVVSEPSDPGITLNPATGAVIVAPGTPPGIYQLAYQACEKANPANCVTTRVVVTVSGGETSMRVIKTATPRDVNVGDLVRYTVVVENTGDLPVVDATLVDTPPAGFTFVDDTLTVADADNTGRLVGRNPLSVDRIDIAVASRATLTYVMRVGAGVRPGGHVNQAKMVDDGRDASNVATAEVQVVGDPMVDETLIVGTVWDDRDADGWQDSAAISGLKAQGGFAPSAYVANSTTVDRGNGPQPEADASAPLLRGIALGKIVPRQSDADPVDAHAVVIRQTLSNLAFTDDFVLSNDQGVTVRMNAAGDTTVEKSGDAAKGLNAAELSVERKVAQVAGGYQVDYIVHSTGVDERGIPGVRIASVEGLLIETDQYGRYHMAGVPGGPTERGRNFILKVDPATLPAGSAFTTDNPLVRRVTPGLPVRFDFGVKLPPTVIEGGRKDVEMELGEVLFAPGQAEVEPQYQPVIDKMAGEVRRHGGGEVVIQANGENQALAYARAQAVQEQLVAALDPAQAAGVKISLRTDADNPGTNLLTLGGTPVLGTFLFDTDQATIKPQFRPLLDTIAAHIESAAASGGSSVIAVVGHADRRGSREYNQALGMRRAKAVYEAIADKLGAAAKARLRVDIDNSLTAPTGLRSGSR